jgi:perosamine synthetase
VTPPSLRELALFGGPATLPDGPRTVSPFGADLVAELGELLQTRPLSSLFGDGDVAELEDRFAALVGTKGAVAVNSGTSSLHCALVALGVGPGDEVAVTCFSFVATASVIVQVGAVPIFVDIDETTLAMDVSDLCAKIGPRTKAVIVAHLFGVPAAIEELLAVCAEHGLALVEDACQALGARVGGKPLGSFGRAGCFSFNVKKIVQTGEGGMLVSDDEDVLAVARELRVNGLSPFGVQRIGFNYTMTNLQARLGCYQLGKFDDIGERRRRYGERIHEALAGVAHLFPERRARVERAHYAVPFRVPVRTDEGRDLIIAALSKEGVPVSGVYEVLYRHESVFGAHGGAQCVVAERVVPSLLSIHPSHLYPEEDVERICKGLRKVLTRAEEIERVAIEEAR